MNDYSLKPAAPKKPHVITPPSQTDDAAERQDETRKVEDQRKAEVEDTRKDVEMDSDDEETRQMGHSDVGEEKMWLKGKKNKISLRGRGGIHIVEVEVKRKHVSFCL